jgi:hypothetical protein
MKINFIIPLKVYPFDVMVSIGESNKKLRKRLKAYGVCKADRYSDIWHLSEVCHGRGVFFGCGRSLVRLKKAPKTANQKGILSHEVFHVADFILRHIGIRLSEDSHEAYGYLIGYLVEEIYKKTK